MGESISGAILFKETLGQSTAAGVPFVKCLKQQGILPGIKVDEVRACFSFLTEDKEKSSSFLF